MATEIINKGIIVKEFYRLNGKQWFKKAEYSTNKKDGKVLIVTWEQK
jgi:hypothetical protein